MTRGRALLGMLLGGGVLLVSEHQVRGYSYFLVGSTPVRWANATSLRWLSPTTFVPGSAPDTLFLGAMGLWNLVPSSRFTYSYARADQDYPIDHFDGFSDTAAVPAEDLDPGVLGVTFMVNSGTQWYDMDLVFPDIPVQIGWNFTPDPNCQVLSYPEAYGYSFYMTAAHELGHAIGLGHDPIGNEPAGSAWFIATMNPRYPAGGTVGDQNIVELHADDCNGARFLYPATGQSPAHRDLGNANFGWSPTPGQPVPLAITPSTVSPGEEFVAGSVIENLGNRNHVGVRQGFYLSTDASITTADELLGTLEWDLAAGDAIEFSVGITLPDDVAAGTYRLGSILDDLNQVNEIYEDNNVHRYCQPLMIRRLAPVIEPLGADVVSCGVPYTGPTPVLTHPINMAPITWTLDAAPAGVTIHPSTGVISWPSPVSASFQYAIIARATNSAGSATSTLLLGVEKAVPEILPIPNASMACGEFYQSPMPQLADPVCMTPILNWSLDVGPTGMTIDFATGRVTWLSPKPSGSPHLVRIRATNVVGNGIREWTLTVATIPGDAGNDGHVGLDDLLRVLTGFGACEHDSGFDAPADFDGSGCIDLADLLIVLSAFGISC